VLNRAGFTSSTRRIVTIASVGLVAAATLTWSNPSSATPKQSIREVSARIDRLNHQAEVATEQFNKIREQVTATHQQLKPLRADVARRSKRVERLRRDVVAAVVNVYSTSAGLTTTASVFLSHNPRDLIQQLSNRVVVDRQSTDLLTRLTVESKRLQVQRDQLQRQYASIKAAETKLAKTRAAIKAKINQAQGILNSLRASERRKVMKIQNRHVVATSPSTSRSVVRPPNVSASGRAKIAVQFAMAQLGKPYVYGAAGPNAYDCSGLTMAAWAAAGVQLSHYAPDQQYAGPRISPSQAVPGDLIFYYSLPSHVAMYIGNGMVIHAPHTGSVVQIVPMNSMPIHSATHIG
jgi:cell wall-associated NlpC family hydrolase